MPELLERDAQVRASVCARFGHGILDGQGRISRPELAALIFRAVDERRALEAVHRCLDRGESFDLTVDDGRPIKGYRRIVRVDDRD
jgi:dephospho-CoA kinase